MVTPPDDLPRPDEIDKMAIHVSHEMERLLWIGELRRRWGWLLYLLPVDTIRRALRVAYAGHARAVLEFYHDGRLDKNGQRKRRERRPDGDIDVQLYDYAATSPGSAHPWTLSSEHWKRLLDADKLLAHVSTGRLVPARAQLSEWGDAEDRARFRTIIEQVVANAPTRFPGTERALAKTRH